MLCRETATFFLMRILCGHRSWSGEASKDHTVILNLPRGYKGA